MSAALAWVPALGVLGAIVGSFLAALVIRWPAGRSVLAGRSACDACGRTLTPIEEGGTKLALSGGVSFRFSAVSATP